MPDDYEKFKIKQTECLICKCILDEYDDSKLLVSCSGCGMKYHKECWNAITSGGCVQCGASEVDDYDTSFVLNEMWDD